MASILSVNLGARRPVAAKSGFSGIDKRPAGGPVHVSAPGPKGTGGSGLAGDVVCDTEHHGGDDQAVYAYAREQYAVWEGLLGRALAAGTFGENLTTAGVDVDGAVIGERWRVGPQLELQVSCPRIPCQTFAVRMGEPRWVRRFTEHGASGAYLRVLQAGPVRAGDAVEVLDRPAHGVTVATAFRALTTRPDLLPLLLEVPQFPAAEREDLARRLHR
ncbi:MOSC domain-containing protein YiiM [Kineococcus xinjiangensis]|uniref:MOSC domain-containing protein YiiM n=1 Tax=Kineococcus xinjiangensis TaxID=512762 RepID=A0A2S6IVS1_9ACTN|nr:MOSC domain-containing protein [Kineococcus xinjiangensis]PPK98164.1 MOSC domain-containing protein YiiM [Kineococcus xinjiangensis]